MRGMGPDILSDLLLAFFISSFDNFQKVVGSHQWLVIHKPEGGFVQFLNDLGLVAAHVSQNPVRADARVATKKKGSVTIMSS